MYEVMADLDPVTLTEFAEKIGVKRTTVENWRRGHVTGPPFPQPIRMRTRLHEWAPADLARWLIDSGRADQVPDEWKPKGRKR